MNILYIASYPILSYRIVSYRLWTSQLTQSSLQSQRHVWSVFVRKSPCELSRLQSGLRISPTNCFLSMIHQFRKAKPCPDRQTDRQTDGDECIPRVTSKTWYTRWRIKRIGSCTVCEMFALITAVKDGHVEHQYTAWLKIKYPRRRHAISPQPQTCCIS